MISCAKARRNHGVEERFSKHASSVVSSFCGESEPDEGSASHWVRVIACFGRGQLDALGVFNTDSWLEASIVVGDFGRIVSSPFQIFRTWHSSPAVANVAVVPFNLLQLRHRNPSSCNNCGWKRWFGRPDSLLQMSMAPASFNCCERMSSDAE